jgi:MFS superfamily sulfate permease-like transporter
MIADTSPRAIVLDVSVQGDLDVTSADMLQSLVKGLHGQGTAVYVAEVHASVLDFGRKTGLLDLIGTEYIFPTVDAAVQAFALADQAALSRQPLPTTS